MPAPAAREAQAAWDAQCDQYFPFIKGFWRFNADDSTARIPHAGWKIHVSATIQSAIKFISPVQEVVARYAACAKVPNGIHGIAKINQGIGAAYSQVGKVFTIYPSDQGEFVAMVADLARAIPPGAWPKIPFDRQVFPDKPIFYRYGILDSNADAQGGRTSYRAPDGSWVEDRRDAGSAVPPWLEDPFETTQTPDSMYAPPSGYLVISTLSQRGKGGVYLAFDLESEAPRLCILKEGRRHGEADPLGMDGSDLVANEYKVLKRIQHLNLSPRIYGYRESEYGKYIKMQPFSGTRLSRTVADSISGSTLRRISLTFLEQLSLLHEEGWVWNDCKPANVLISEYGKLTFIDFEGACHIEDPLYGAYGSPGYMAPEKLWDSHASAPQDDVYSAGGVLLELAGCRMTMNDDQVYLRGTPSRLPNDLRSWITAMRSKDPRQRPPVRAVCDAIKHSQEWTG